MGENERDRTCVCVRECACVCVYVSICVSFWERQKKSSTEMAKKEILPFFLLLCNKSGQPSQNCFLTRKPPGVKSACEHVSVCKRGRERWSFFGPLMRGNFSPFF